MRGARSRGDLRALHGDRLDVLGLQVLAVIEWVIVEMLASGGACEVEASEHSGTAAYRFERETGATLSACWQCTQRILKEQAEARAARPKPTPREVNDAAKAKWIAENDPPPLPLVDEAPAVADNRPKWPIATVLEVRIFGTFPAADFNNLTAVAGAHSRQLREAFDEAGGRDSLVQWVEVRPATREEVLHIQPRKIHYSEDGRRWLCGTERVARRNLTAHREEVTCRLCKRGLGIRED